LRVLYVVPYITEENENNLKDKVKNHIYSSLPLTIMFTKDELIDFAISRSPANKL